MGVLDQLLAELSQRKTNPLLAGSRATGFPSGVPDQLTYLGPRSLFGVQGLERDLISSRIQVFGLADQLPAVGTNMMNPVFGYFQGFSMATGPNANGVCDDPPTAGPGSTCFQTAQFGRYSFQTRELEVNHMGQITNRGEFHDLRFINDPLAGNPGGITVPSSVPTNIQLRREAQMRMIELGSSFQLTLARQLYEGNPANNTAGGGYKEFPGLDILIGANKVDAFTNVRCQNLDSDIKDFNNQRISIGTGPSSIIEMLSNMMRYLRWNAEQSAFGAVDWAIVMRPGLFWELSAVWPCSYMTYRCTTLSPDAVLNLEASSMIAMRDGMRNEQYILIDGIRYPVILDNAIREDTHVTVPAIPAGVWSSDVYVIPLRARGGIPVTYWEYFDYNGGPMDAVGDANASAFYWTDAGRYLWHLKPPINWCLQWMAKIEPRLILRTPHLAGRILNVAYSMLQHERDAYPTDPYYVSGGVSTGRPGPSMSAEWGQVR